ncbi:hypothetical protein [Amycolatopsis thermoflava]|uniref:hypothetical protein n=1 Tax=Amycolatopsis thermoflava TaxID=84480 RepID=UPI0038049732
MNGQAPEPIPLWVVPSPDLRGALEELLRVFDHDLPAARIAPQLTCWEATAFADLLRTAGAPQAAERWLQYHAMDDAPGDPHYDFGGPPDNPHEVPRWMAIARFLRAGRRVIERQVTKTFRTLI